MNTNTLRRIAERLRTIEPSDSDTAKLHYQRLTSQSAEWLSRHWPADLGPFPFPADDPEMIGNETRRTAVWGLVWRSVCLILQTRFPGEFSSVASNRAVSIMRPTDGVAVIVTAEHPDDGRERSRDAAEILDWLADRLGGCEITAENPSETPGTPSGQAKSRTKPRMTQKKVQEHWQEVWASGNSQLILEYLTGPETALAEKIGCSRNTLRGCEWFKKRGIALHEFNRKNR